MAFNNSLESALSVERFASYRSSARDDSHAWQLYRWNLKLVSALTPIMSDFEVTLRNTIHDHLTQIHGRTDWCASPQLRLDDQTHQNTQTVVHKHRKKLNKGSVGLGRVIADLTLGTWVMLLGKGGISILKGNVGYEDRLWRPALRNGFATGGTNSRGNPNRPMRRVAHTRASNLQQVRNAAAHHRRISEGIRPAGAGPEIPRVPLEKIWHETIEMLGWMSPELKELHIRATEFPAALAARPT